ncbi:MAG TPA: hypothetical protein VGC32_14985 [Solirubrobacterales bacterium]
MSFLRRRAARFATLGAAAVAALAVSAAPASAATIPAGGLNVEHASLDWSGSTVMQTPLFFGPTSFYHYFSAGSSDGTEATYKGAEGNAEVLLEAEGPEAVATWATHTNFSAAAGHHQVVRLLNGSGRIEADGSAKISWDATFSVNFYGGSVPFSVEDPTLTVKPDGSGEVTATLSGCAASKADPSAPCTPFTPSPEAQIETFTGVHIDPEATLTVTPNYAGVEVESTPAQNRSVEGWGAWPQAMVTFQDQTGLSSYFYSSGSGEDPNKPPLPFVVDFKGPTPIPPATTSPGTGATTTPPSAPAPAPVTTPTSAGSLKAMKGARKLSSSGVATVATFSCPSGGSACKTVVPKHVAAKIGGKRWLLAVIAPKKIGAGKSAAVKVRLPKGARAALGTGKLAVSLSIVLKANGNSAKHLLKAKIVGSN